MSNKIICKKIASMLSLYIDNKVSLQESSFIEEHLSNCKECQKKYLYLKSLIKDLKASYKQVLELTMKKQQQKLFKIREHEKFLENISPYVDNELDAKECFEFRKYLMKSKNAQRELKNIYVLQKKMKLAYDNTKKSVHTKISKKVINTIKHENLSENKTNIKRMFFSPKSFKIAILSGLVLIGGYEFDQLAKQYDIKPKQVKQIIKKEKANSYLHGKLKFRLSNPRIDSNTASE